MSTYKDLDAWKLGMALAGKIYSVSRSFPTEEKYQLTSQLSRAAISVPTNIAEGMGRRTKRDTIQFLYISRGSLYELETLMALASSLGYVQPVDLENISVTLTETQKVLNGLIRYFDHANLV